VANDPKSRKYLSMMPHPTVIEGSREAESSCVVTTPDPDRAPCHLSL
jgi:hypothetical protein